MHFWIILLVLCESLVHVGKVEVIEFDIHRGDKVVGELVARKEMDGDRVIYKSTTDASISILFKIDVQYHFVVEFRDSAVYRADAEIHVNGNQHVETKMELENGKYIFKKNEEAQKKIDYPVEYPAILLLFMEPEGVNASFSEEEGRYHEIRKIDQHRYEKINPKGKVNEYQYADGKLKSAFLDAGIFQFKIERRE